MMKILTPIDYEDMIVPAVQTHESRCDECHMYPIIGALFTCSGRTNYDLCSSCEDKRPQPFPMLKTYIPVTPPPTPTPTPPRVQQVIMEPVQYAAPRTSSKQSSMKNALNIKMSHDTKVGALKLGTAVVNLFAVLNKQWRSLWTTICTLHTLLVYFLGYDKFASRSGMFFVFKDKQVPPMC